MAAKLQIHIVAILLAAALAACRRADETTDLKPPDAAEETAETNQPPSMDAGLILMPGPPGGDSLVMVRLFSLSARQFACRPSGSNVPPVNLDLGGDPWKTGARFRATDSNGIWETARTIEARLIKPGPTGRVSLAPMDSLSATYLLPAGANLNPGDLIRAEIRLPAPWTSSISRAAIVPPPSDDIRVHLARRALIEEQTGDFGSLLKSGDALIAAWSNRPIGFWYKALALEGLNRPAEALAVHRQALQVALDHAPPGMEPPMPILERIAQLSDQLQTTPASPP